MLPLNWGPGHFFRLHAGFSFIDVIIVLNGLIKADAPDGNTKKL